MQDEQDELLSTEQMAKLIGVAPNTLEVWRCTKRVNLPYIKIGPRIVRYRKSVGLQFLEANTKS